MTDEKPKTTRKKKPKLAVENKIVKLNRNVRWIHDALKYHADARKVVMIVEYGDGFMGYSYKNCSQKDIYFMLDYAKNRILNDYV